MFSFSNNSKENGSTPKAPFFEVWINKSKMPDPVLENYLKQKSEHDFKILKKICIYAWKISVTINILEYIWFVVLKNFKEKVCLEDMTELYRLIKRKYYDTGNKRKKPKIHGRIKIFVIVVKKK